MEVVGPLLQILIYYLLIGTLCGVLNHKIVEWREQLMDAIYLLRKRAFEDGWGSRIPINLIENVAKYTGFNPEQNQTIPDPLPTILAYTLIWPRVIRYVPNHIKGLQVLRKIRDIIENTITAVGVSESHQRQLSGVNSAQDL